MFVKLMKSKIHEATITESNLDYEGSITIDEELIDKAGLAIGEEVQVLNKNNGERLETYVIKGERGSGEICLNGPAARKGHIGDKVIIISYGYYKKEEIDKQSPKIILLNNKNEIKKSM